MYLHPWVCIPRWGNLWCSLQGDFGTLAVIDFTASPPVPTSALKSGFDFTLSRDTRTAEDCNPQVKEVHRFSMNINPKINTRGVFAYMDLVNVVPAWWWSLCCNLKTEPLELFSRASRSVCIHGSDRSGELEDGDSVDGLGAVTLKRSLWQGCVVT